MEKKPCLPLVLISQSLSVCVVPTTDLSGVDVLAAGVEGRGGAGPGRLGGPQTQQGAGQREAGPEGLVVGRGVRRSLLVVRVDVLQTLVVGGGRSLPVTAETPAEQGEEP